MSKKADTAEKPLSSPTKEKSPLASVSQVFSFARTRQTKLQLLGAFFFALISGCTFPAMIFYFAQAFEDLARPTESDDFMDTVRSMVYAFLILGVVILFSMTAENFLAETAATTMTHNLKTDWFRALLRQDMAYYDIRDVSGEATIISTNGNRYHRGVGRKLAESVQYFINFVGATTYAFYASWKVSLAVLAISPILMCSVSFLLKMNQTQTARANATYARAGSIVTTAISSIRTILSLNAVDRTIEEYKDATTEAHDGAVGQVWLVGLAHGSQFASFMLSYVVVTLFGTWLLYDSVVDSGCDPSGTVEDNERCDPSGVDVFGALMGISFGAAILPQISVSMEKFNEAREACFPALKVIHRAKVTAGKKDGTSDQTDSLQLFHRGESELPPYVIDSSCDAGMKPSAVSGEIVFNDVSFAYPTRKEIPVFKGFSLTIPAGKTVALVGPSGCGKSSAVQLLERFYDVDSGSITLDGNDIRDLNIGWLRRQLGLVSQEPKLFATSIRENIAAGAPDATEEQIIEAAKLANAHDFISSFPQGYDTQVGDLGGQLSGGQKQRIAISRVLLKKPKVMILDEATSALDSESENSVQKALDEIVRNQGITTLVIAHRLSTIRSADMIVVVADGKVAETGKHNELLSRQFLYADMVAAQSAKADSKSDSAISTPNTTEHGSLADSVESSNDYGSGEKPVIQFHHVDFAYPTRPDSKVFNGLNLTVRRGETLALVGPSGSGKSSAIQLIENFYRPTAGFISFNGEDMSELNVRWLRDQLGLVSQEPILFDTTVEENIRYGCPNASFEQVVEAAKQANAHDFISTFPDGYQTRVGQGSTLVSGGQKQRIAIARALIKRPVVLLLDEATSALDSHSEKIVQDALDKIMFGTEQTCVVVAHRLSTIRNADRIAVIERGRITEIGSHAELIARPGGHYQKLCSLQDLSADLHSEEKDNTGIESERKDEADQGEEGEKKAEVEEAVEVSKEKEKDLAKKASIFGKEDTFFLMVGGAGALLTGIMFPSWGFIFAYMTEILFYPVYPCPSSPAGVDDIAECDDYLDNVKDYMHDRSFDIFYGFIGVIVSSLIGYVLLFVGFGWAVENMNKRTRDAAFTSLLRQEVGWFDVRSPGSLTSRLSDDAALLRAYNGEPIRTLSMTLASVLVGVVVAFIYMWPFALLTIGLLPFMAFGAEMEMRTYLGEDEGDANQIDEHSPGGIVIATLADIRTVASLTLEPERAEEYARALTKEDPHPVRNNIVKGGGSALGQFTQMWGFGLMFFFGGWVLDEHSDEFTYREYLIALFAFMFSLYGLSAAFEGTADREKAKAAAFRIFEVIERQSLIDPLTDEGKKQV